MTHALKRAYNGAIKSRYGVKLWGDKHPERTEIIAQRVRQLGLDYDMFVNVALSLWDSWCEGQGHNYPYWNIITSDRTFEMLDSLGSLEDNETVKDDYGAEFMVELQYAQDFIAWWRGELNSKPISPRASTKVKIQVAEYLCRMYGIEMLSSNYIDIAQMLNGHVG